MLEYRLVDTGQRRRPAGREMYLYIPTGEIHNWEDSDFQESSASDREPKDFAILTLAPPPPAPMTYRRAAELALQCQDACNLSGVVASLKTAVHEAIWPEARKREKGTDWVNRNPIVFMFLYKLTALNSSEDLSAETQERYHDAERQCQGIVQSQEVIEIIEELGTKS